MAAALFQSASEQAIINRLHTLDDTRLIDIFDFVEFIHKRYAPALITDQT